LTGGPYAQYGPKLRVIFPGWTGGANWSGVAFDPNLGYIFTNVKNLGNFNKLVRRPDGTWSRVGPDNPPQGLGTDFAHSPSHRPCQAPPWGELSAVNANTGDIVWRVPLGIDEELEAKGLPKTGAVNVGGPIVTAGGLVFIGATIDDRFRAFDARTGEELWVTKLSASAHSVPITYRGKDGKQYVAVMASGGHSGSQGRPGVLHVFTLP
jgi:quinoprotein glucose dehydrogenase